MPLLTPGSSRSVSPVSSAETGIYTPDNSSLDSAAISAVFRIFEKCAAGGDAIENAAKDMACLVHSLDLVSVTLDRIRRMPFNLKLARVYNVLVANLKALVNKPVPPISSRMVYVEVPSNFSPISIDLLRTLFPNMQKVWRVITSTNGRKCLVEFASHSSARRAVDSRQMAGNFGHQSNSQVKCSWASAYAHIPPLRIEYITELPIVETMDDESAIAPSLDWRRPRPRSESSFAITCADVFSTSDLLSVLERTGAFDDYPPLLSQLRF
jgi:hypothetical protein